ncbi:Pleckstrin homology domain-containing family H member 2 [Clarias magur]|uniref:Pleckstrin homology domain-containing family H member 2 n=1 Tax=Clarias magur TaxID=1594786 RepID=A0A8J5C8Y2_CLAMG|nr:Pleckstrin homology domain-containing family H member 2 [Clarias magur]
MAVIDVPDVPNMDKEERKYVQACPVRPLSTGMTMILGKFIPHVSSLWLYRLHLQHVSPMA